jgi:hypothetical protein
LVLGEALVTKQANWNNQPTSAFFHTALYMYNITPSPGWLAEYRSLDALSLLCPLNRLIFEASSRHRLPQSGRCLYRAEFGMSWEIDDKD